MRLKSSFISFVLVFVAWLDGQLLFPASGCIYLFSHDAKFVEVETEKFELTDVGNLWWMEISDVDEVIPHTSGQDILLKAKVWKALDIENPSAELFEMRGLFVLHRAPREGLSLKKVISPPSADHTLVEGRMFDLNGPKLFLTWSRHTAGKQELSVNIYGDLYQHLKTMDFEVYLNSCLSADKRRIYTPVVGSPRQIRIFDLAQEGAQSRSYEAIGRPEFFSKTIVASRECLVLIIERTSREEPTSTFYLYDMDQAKVVSEFRLPVLGDFHLLKEGKVVLVDETRYVPVGENAARRTKIGKLRVFNSETGREISTVTLPQEGRLIGVSPDEKIGYYFSPEQLTILDFETWAIKKAVRVPFREAKLGFYLPN